MIDPTGRLLTDIRDWPAVAALTTRVRSPEPMGRQISDGGVETDAGDARGPGKWVRFVVLARLGRHRNRHTPIQEVRYSARCYGLDARDAAALAGAVSDAIHGRGRRITSAGISIVDSFDEDSEGAASDPTTGQPYESVIISVSAFTVSVSL